MTRLYVHEATDERMRVVDIPEGSTLRSALALDHDDLVWLEDQEDEALDPDERVDQLADGGHAHVFRGRCRRVEVTVRYGGKEKDRAFAPGVRLARVLRWATGDKGFDLDPGDADELTLQLCGSDTRPDLSEHLGSFAHPGCSTCFDVVPKDRFQG